MKKYLSLLKIQSCFRESARMNSYLCWTACPPVTRSYRKGEYVFSRGEHIDSVALLLEGCIHIQKEDYWGNLSILSEISEGEIFGEVYACLGSDEILNNAVAVNRGKVLFSECETDPYHVPVSLSVPRRLIRNLLAVLAQKE